MTVIHEQDDVLLDTVTTTNGYVDIIATGNMTVNTVTAGGTGRDVWLTSNAADSDIIIPGNITALDDVVYLNATGDITDTTDETSRIRAGTLQIDAADTVGSWTVNGRLDTEVTWYLNHRVTAGDAFFYEVDDVILRDLEYRAGRLDLYAGGSIFGSHRFPADAVEGFYGMTLRAGGIIGTPYDPLWIDAPYGRVIVMAYSYRDEISVNLKTETPFSYNHEPTDLFLVNNYTPGLVLYNYRLMGGAPIYNILQRGYYVLDASYNVDMLYPYYNRWKYDRDWMILSQKIASASNLLTDQRYFGSNVFLNMEDLGFKLNLDKGRLVILKDGLKQMDLGQAYPLQPRFTYPPFWVNDLR
jgi:hypothetical protein